MKANSKVKQSDLKENIKVKEEEGGTKLEEEIDYVNNGVTGHGWDCYVESETMDVFVWPKDKTYLMKQELKAGIF